MAQRSLSEKEAVLEENAQQMARDQQTIADLKAQLAKELSGR